MSIRLTELSVNNLQQIQQPSYNRKDLPVAIVHLGIGAFHRAHQAVYTDAVNNQFSAEWGIIGCSLRSDSVKKQLQPQDMLYSVMQKGEDVTTQIIGCIKEVLVGPENPQAIIDAIALPSVRILSLTVTEKGYCHFPATGMLNQQHPDIAHDINNLHAPRSAIGYIVAGLQQRMRNNLEPVTVLSCDNLPHNGRVVEKVVVEFAHLIDPTLGAWIAEHIAFPCTMVDRIVPATTEEDLQLNQTTFGFDDKALVVAEPFSQWVIENRFSQARPAWEKVGALLVDDVDTYETMKLRLLNGSHSFLAYVGYLAGCETIYQTMQHATLKQLCQQFMASAASTLSAPQNFDLSQYQAQLIQRFSNPSLKHRTWQIAMDGSQKVPQRWLNTLRTLLKNKQDYGLFALALAAWMRFASGEDEQGKSIDVSDPLNQQFRALYQQFSHNPEQYVRAFFAQESVFSTDFQDHQTLIQKTVDCFLALNSQGTNKLLTQWQTN